MSSGRSSASWPSRLSAAITFAEADEPVVGEDFDDDARETGMRAEGIAQRRFNGDKGRSPFDVSDFHLFRLSLFRSCRN